MKLIFSILSYLRKYVWMLWFLMLGFADAIIQMSKIDDMMKEEANNLSEVINALHVKHKDYAVSIENYLSCHLRDQSEIKRLAGSVTYLAYTRALIYISDFHYCFLQLLCVYLSG